MSGPTLLAQIVAVLSRRTPAFTPAPGQPATFGAAVHRLMHHHRDPPTPVAPNQPPTNTDDSALTQFADQFAALPGQERLAARSWLVDTEMQLSLTLLKALEHSHVLALDLNRALDRAPTLDLDRAPDFDLDRTLDRTVDLNRLLDSDRVLDRAHGPVFVPVLDVILDRVLEPQLELRVAPDLDRVLDRLLDRAHSLAGNLAHKLDHNLDFTLARVLVRLLVRLLERTSEHDPALARALGLGLDLVGVLAGVLAGVLIRVLTDLLVRGRDAGFASDTFVVPAVTEHTTQTELDAMSHALKRLDSAQRNMIDTDLRGIDLRDMDDRERLLDGVRWSTGTRWPPELQGWVDQHSEQIGLDLYEIHTHDKARSRAKSS